MADVLIRDIPPEDLARIDAQAAKLRISRAEFIRRRLLQEARRATEPASRQDFQELTGLCQDLLGEDFDRRMWT